MKGPDIERLIRNARQKERDDIRIMLDTVGKMLLESDLPHNVCMNLPVTDIIFDVLGIVSDGLATGISVNRFKHLYPKQETPSGPRPEKTDPEDLT